MEIFLDLFLSRGDVPTFTIPFLFRAKKGLKFLPWNRTCCEKEKIITSKGPASWVSPSLFEWFTRLFSKTLHELSVILLLTLPCIIPFQPVSQLRLANPAAVQSTSLCHWIRWRSAGGWKSYVAFTNAVSLTAFLFLRVSGFPFRLPSWLRHSRSISGNFCTMVCLLNFNVHCCFCYK